MFVWPTLTYLLVMINPFSQVLYLWDLMREMDTKTFAWTYLRASALSWGVFIVFALTGPFLFTQVFQVSLDSFRIFGGLIILLVAVRYFTHGAGSNVLFKRAPDDDLAPQIALPYQVGPGTIWVSMMIGQRHSAALSLAAIALVLLVNALAVSLCALIVNSVKDRGQTLAGKYFAILMRTNALFVGAISVDMIVNGIKGVIAGGAV
ncbi:MAG: hypothetical protein GC164_01895 [Phycisphaera sp.]|nr:hypothetical protein [Phycisphaera sp.]